MSNTAQESQKHRRFRPFRFTLRTLFVLMAIASIWIGLKVNAVRRQQAVVAELSKMQIMVHYDHQHDALPPQQLALRGSAFGPMAFPNQPTTTPNAPRWIRGLIGDDYFQTVTAVTLLTNELPDIKAALLYLKQLPQLKEIFLSSPSCGNAIPTYTKAKQFLERELPNVKVTGFGIPIVG